MIAQALRLIRTFHDQKLVEAAEQLGISKSYLSEVERGLKAPTLQLIERYATTYNIPASSILFFAENINEPLSRQRARHMVAGKVIAILQFLDAKTNGGMDARE
jgi:transcriptional regulator with XRE-family HTH domain